MKMVKSHTLIDLKPERKLLDPEFDGYKLSLEPVPIYRRAFQTGVDHVTPSDEQYSFLHAKLFGLHNHLFGDPWSENAVYFIDCSWKVLGNVNNTALSEPPVLHEVFEVPSHHERQPGHYNLSLSFASPALAVIADGAGTLHILHTGDRVNFSNKWRVVSSVEPIGQEKPFIVVDSRYTGNELHCLLLHVCEEEITSAHSEGKESKTKFMSVIDWITFEGDIDNWNMTAVRKLVGRGGVDFISLEKSCTAVYVASDHSFKFQEDSLHSIEEAGNDTDKKEEVKSQILFSWLQTGDDVTVWLPLPPDINKPDLTVMVTSLHLQISIHGEITLEGDLYQRVDTDLTSWTISEGKLELVLSKTEFGVVWPEVLVNDKRGEEIIDPEFVKEVHERLAHLCSENLENSANGSALSFNSQQLEDCDALPQDSAVLLRLDATTHAVSHQANLGGHQWLFNTRLPTDGSLAICLRHDVDACLWELDSVNTKNNVWPVTHIGTFHAFGYVQASKQQRKFSLCSPDMSYVAICDATRHVYLYRQPGIVGSELRNRSTGRRVAQIAKQQLVQLEAGSQVLGAHATSRNLFILTTDTLYMLALVL